jgi:glycosyltransferase involved in cell wall biosynthesis
LRVLHLIGSFVGGGAERQLALLAPELARLGVDVHVGFLHGGVNLDLLQKSSVALHKIDSFGNMDPSIVLRLVALVRGCRPHLVQTWLTQMDVLGGLAARICGVPVILSERASAPAYSLAWRDRLRRRVGRSAAAVVANSSVGLEYWRVQRKEGKLLTIRNGIPLDRIRTSVTANPETLGWPSTARVVLFAGRLVDPQKNIPLLLLALDEVLSREEDVVAVLCGEGPLRVQMEARISHSPGSERIRLLGFADNLWGWMRRADVLVSVSRFEGNPNVVLEAMAIGCPIVVSDIPEHREILDETTARFCSVDSASDMASAIVDTLNAPIEARKRTDIARKRVADWSLENCALRYLDIYKQVAQGAGTQR